MTTESRVQIGWIAIVALAAAACSGGSSGATLTDAPSPSSTATTAPESSTSTTLPPETTVPNNPSGFEFVQLTDSNDLASVNISYPRVVDQGLGGESQVNRVLDDWAATTSAEFLAIATAAGSTLEAQLAPEVINGTVFSVGGLVVEYDAATNFGFTSRVGHIFTMVDGALHETADLFLDGDLQRLAEEARTQLESDVLDGVAITTPEGLLPTDSNFDAVWLTPEGIAVGFDQYQVVAGELGSPAVVIPYADLADVIDTAGALSALVGGTMPSDL